MIHGGAATATFNWEKHIPFFSKHFRVIAPDSRGHGKTENPTGEFSYKLMVDDFAELIRKLELGRALICGYSDGGQIALELGINHPTLAKAIVAGGATSILTDKMKKTINSWGVEKPGVVDFNQLEKQFGNELLTLLSNLHAPVYGKEYWKTLWTNLSRMWLNPLEYPRENIRKINSPVLIILGDSDEVLPVEEGVKMFRMIPDAELAIIPRADHFLFVNKPELFNTVVADFLLRHNEIFT